MNEILKYEADTGNTATVRFEVIETILYQRALMATQKAMTDGYPLSQSLIKGIHQRLLSGGRGASKSPGRLKNEQNYLGIGKVGVIFFLKEVFNLWPAR